MDNGGSITWNLDIDDRGFTSGLSKASAEATAFSGSLAKTNFQDFSKNASTAFNGVATGIATLAKVATGLFIGGALGAGVFVRQASELQSLKASFESMTGSAEEANKVLRQLNKFSFETAFSTLDINKAAQLLLGAGVRVEDLGKRMRQIGDIAGATGANLGALTLPLSQALARGKLQTQDFYQILNSGAGTFRKVLEEEVIKRGLGNLQDALAAGTIDTEVLGAALDAANQKGGFAFEGAIKQSKTFAGQMSNLKETIGNVALAVLGIDKATGTVKAGGIFDNLTKSAQAAQKWLNENQKSIQRIASIIVNNAVPALAALAAAFVTAKSAAIGFSVYSNITSALRAYEAATLAAARANVTLSLAQKAAFFANPIALVITAIVAALVFLQVKFNIFGKTIKFIGDLMSDVGNIFQRVWGHIKDIVSDTVGRVENLFNKIRNLLAPWRADFMSTLTGTLKDAGKALIDYDIETLKKWGSNFKDIIKATEQWGKDFFKSIQSTLADTALSIGRFFSELPGKVGNFVSNAATNIAGFFTNLPEKIIKFFEDAYHGIINFFASLPSRVGASAERAGLQMADSTSKGIKGYWSDQNKMAKIGEVIILGLGLLLASILIGLIDLNVRMILAIRDAVMRVVDASITWLFRNGVNLVQGFANGILSASLAPYRAIKYVADLIGPFFANAGSWLFDAGVAIIKGLANGIVSASLLPIHAIQGIISGSIKAAKDLLKIKSPSQVFADIGRNVGLGIVQGIDSTQQNVKSSISSLSNALGVDSTFNLTPNIAGVGATSSGSSPSVVQNNNIYNQVDLDQVTRDLAWRLQVR